MRKVATGFLVVLIMLIAVLGITNPGRKQYERFDNIEGKLTHNYFIFSVYQQYTGYTLTADGKYRLYRRYLGIARTFHEISPAEEKQE